MRYGFFNSEITGTDENGMPIFDRAEQADFFAKYFSSFVRNGVMPNSFEATVNGATLTLSPGVVFIEGYFGWESEETQISLTPGSQTVVARLDLSNRTITIDKKTAGLDPVRTDDVYELYLYDATYSDSGVVLEDYRTDSNFCGRMGAHNPTIYTGKDAPPNSLGENGDIYIQY